MSPDGTVVEGGGGYTDNGEEDDEFQGGRIVTARWSLVPEPGADRELAIKAGNVSLPAFMLSLHWVGFRK
jgi:hypothetical protein